jgi:hypothetical protein
MQQCQALESLLSQDPSADSAAQYIKFHELELLVFCCTLPSQPGIIFSWLAIFVEAFLICFKHQQIDS